VDRRAFLSSMSSLAGAVAAPLLSTGSYASAQSPAAAKEDGTVIAKTIYGQVRGTSSDGWMVFKGIPHAGSPAGMNRFKAPPKLQPWKGVKDAQL